MLSFRRKKVEVDEVEDVEQKIPKTKIKDLTSRNRRRRKEPIKIWTKRERIIVVAVLALTIATPVGLALSSKRTNTSFNFPKFALPTLTETVVITKDDGEKFHVYKKPIKDRQALISSINTLTADLTGNYDIWVEELGGEKLSYGINEDKPTEGASLFKLPLMIAVYRGIESGKVDKDAVSDALYRLAKNSDNGAFVQLSNIVGYASIKKAIVDAQMENTSIDDSATTPHDIGNLYKNMMVGNLVSDSSKEEILDLLTNTSFELLIPEGIPDVRVAHKYATTTGVLNDGGIVFAKNPFILVIMTEEADIEEAKVAIPQISKLIYNFEVEN